MSARPVIIGGLLVAGAWLIYLGFDRWMDQRAAESTIEEFLAAVRAGEFDRATTQLSARRRAALDDTRKTSKPFDTAIDGLRWRIAHLEIEGDTATAEVQMEKEGFNVTPVLHLVRDGHGEWKIDRIENLFVDPAWEQRQRDRAKKRDDQTARELQRALRNARKTTAQQTSAATDDAVESR